jgi:hyperosmotically inducible periplasmic protein
MRDSRVGLRVALTLLSAVLAFGFVACSTTQSAGTQIDDAAITAAVKAKLAADPDVAAINIDVDTNSAVVTLSGKVENANQRSEAERLARETDGVQRVINNLTVGDENPVG